MAVEEDPAEIMKEPSAKSPICERTIVYSLSTIAAIQYSPKVSKPDVDLTQVISTLLNNIKRETSKPVEIKVRKQYDNSSRASSASSFDKLTRASPRDNVEPVDGDGFKTVYKKKSSYGSSPVVPAHDPARPDLSSNPRTHQHSRENSGSNGRSTRQNNNRRNNQGYDNHQTGRHEKTPEWLDDEDIKTPKKKSIEAFDSFNLADGGNGDDYFDDIQRFKAQMKAEKSQRSINDHPEIAKEAELFFGDFEKSPHAPSSTLEKPFDGESRFARFFDPEQPKQSPRQQKPLAKFVAGEGKDVISFLTGGNPSNRGITAPTIRDPKIMNEHEVLKSLMQQKNKQQQTLHHHQPPNIIPHPQQQSQQLQSPDPSEDMNRVLGMLARSSIKSSAPISAMDKPSPVSPIGLLPPQNTSPYPNPQYQQRPPFTQDFVSMQGRGPPDFRPVPSPQEIMMMQQGIPIHPGAPPPHLQQQFRPMYPPPPPAHMMMNNNIHGGRLPPPNVNAPDEDSLQQLLKNSINAKQAMEFQAVEYPGPFRPNMSQPSMPTMPPHMMMNQVRPNPPRPH